jgi:hypothetical protein
VPTDRGDANCDGAVEAADVSALVVFYATASRASCGGDDANGNGIIDTGDFQALIVRIFSDE